MWVWNSINNPQTNLCFKLQSLGALRHWDSNLWHLHYLLHNLRSMNLGVHRRFGRQFKLQHLAYSSNQEWAQESCWWHWHLLRKTLAQSVPPCESLHRPAESLPPILFNGRHRQRVGVKQSCNVEHIGVEWCKASFQCEWTCWLSWHTISCKRPALWCLAQPLPGHAFSCKDIRRLQPEVNCSAKEETKISWRGYPQQQKEPSGTIQNHLEPRNHAPAHNHLEPSRNPHCIPPNIPEPSKPSQESGTIQNQPEPARTRTRSGTEPLSGLRPFTNPTLFV